MVYQLVFSLLAIALLYLFNKKIGGYNSSSFKNEQMAIDIVKQDIPNTKTAKLGQLLFLNNSTAIFEYNQTLSKNNLGTKPVFVLSQAIGDIYVSRLLPVEILLNCVKNIEVIGNKYSINIKTADLTLPEITIKFNDTDALYYWFLDNKKISHPQPLNAPTTSMEAQ